jgi:glycogen operon protein
MHWEPLTFEIPAPPQGMTWHIFANTGMETPNDSYEPGREPALSDQQHILVGDRSVVILVGK